MCQGRIKRGAVCCLGLLVLLTGGWLTGCGAKQVNEPVEASYIVKNPLKISNRAVEGQDGLFESVEYKVSGLKDKEIEVKINDKIKSTIDNLKGSGPPPLRGVKALLGENPKLQEERIYANEMGNFNNILSLMVMRSSKYQGADKYFDQIECLNFDLNTGEMFALKDAFCDNTDYLAYVDDCVSERLHKENAEDEEYSDFFFSNIKLAGTFTGVKPEQKFYIDGSSGGIYLAFDYETPEFYTQDGYWVLDLPITENLAITERFFDEGVNIFESKEPREKNLLSIPPSEEVIDKKSEELQGGLILSTNLKYPKTLDHGLQQQLRDMMEPDEGMIKDAEADMEKVREKYGENSIYGSYEKYVSARQAGKFINVDDNETYYIGGQSKEDDQSYTSITGGVREYRTYREGSSVPMTLSEVFVPEADMEKLVKHAMEVQLNSVEWISKEEARKLREMGIIEDLYSRINGFMLQNSCLILSFDMKSGEMSDQPGREKNVSQYKYALCNLAYKDLGCDNLTIFD